MAIIIDFTTREILRSSDIDLPKIYKITYRETEDKVLFEYSNKMMINTDKGVEKAVDDLTLLLGIFLEERPDLVNYIENLLGDIYDKEEE